MDLELSYFLSEIVANRSMLLQGAWTTVSVSALAIASGTLLGILIGLALAYGTAPLRWPARLYVDLIRGTPVLVLVLATYYMSTPLGLPLTPFQAGAVALCLFCASHVAEIWRGALQALPIGQLEAGRAIGLTFPRICLYVLFPQAMRLAMPTWVTAAAEMVKASTLLSVIGVAELLLTSQQIISNNFLNLQFYFLAGAIYFAINFCIDMLGKYLSRHLEGAGKPRRPV
ncbi:amino acid ABC transporter permease [Halotalea alkalilenta]|uniref:ABC transporter permease n=1 Tax=Halotalea alkalilenta TaxID=376489 RepID=A0A172YG08_9GAMM|nr:amino acid ABC transporter permease [Halotalea alkalilenta]ANF58144.1 ABC transporter permease [Halotalea alkalilenta]